MTKQKLVSSKHKSISIVILGYDMLENFDGKRESYY